MIPKPPLSTPLLVYAGIVILAIMGVGLVFFDWASFHRGGEAVIIKASDTPVKTRPADPGGLDIDNLDSPILGLLDGPDNSSQNGEVLTPPADAPEPPPIAVESLVDNKAAGVGQAETETPLQKTNTDGAFVVQFAAFKSEQSALEIAAILGQKHSTRLNGIRIGYTRHNDFWRVITDPLSSYNDAKALCAKFISNGQDCFVRELESP